MLAAQVHVGRGHWKSIAECTADDLTYARTERRRLVRRIEDQIVHYDRLIALLRQHHKQTVAELPPQSSW